MDKRVKESTMELVTTMPESIRKTMERAAKYQHTEPKNTNIYFEEEEVEPSKPQEEKGAPADDFQVEDLE